MQTKFESCTFGIVGTGLIGASMAKAIAQRYPQGMIYLFDHDQTSATEVCEILPNTKVVALEEMSEVDFVIICTPVSYIVEYANKLGNIVDPTKCTITDVGSTKAWIASAASEAGLNHFVPGHLLAGGTSSGPQNASIDIIFGRQFALTPHQTTLDAHTVRLKEFLRTIGLSVQVVEPDLHDDVLAITSHIPHMLAYALVDILGKKEDAHRRDFSTLEVNSFRQMTHFVKGSPEMWADIIMSNKTHITKGIEALFEAAQTYNELAKINDKPSLIKALNKLRDQRNRPADQSEKPSDLGSGGMNAS